MIFFNQNNSQLLSLKGVNEIRITLGKFIATAQNGGIFVLIAPSSVMRRYAAHKNIRGPVRDVPMYSTAAKIILTDSKVIIVAFPHDLLQNITWAGIRTYKEEDVSFVDSKTGIRIIIGAAQSEEVINSLTVNFQKKMIKTGFTNKEEMERFTNLAQIQKLPQVEIQFNADKKINTCENIVYLQN